jgi:putative membrane-bound dehydrogenase-like protein
MSFDDRGRLWVLQYLQYPNPAGLKPVKVDQYLRTKYDRIPEPPPKGPRGADRLTILYDPDANGRFTKAKDFVTGLNLASGFCLGNGGVYVAQPPYLLFYPDRNGDDIPDRDPEVLLTGFGMDDAHAFANSLQWGSDGWLYGAHGSTAYANIRGIEFVQGIWRYHPITREFELFSEGGGNTWGLDFDRQGNAIAGTNFGGVAMLHQMQGAYHVKNFIKHGELKNPHAYGYFGHVPYKGFKGGHVTCGGIVYQGGAFPEQFNNQYIAGNLLSNAVYWHKMEKFRSTFKASFGGDFLLAHDTWFRPVDCLSGPDGAVYVADWYDKRATHLDPRDTWDRTNGRIYKIQPNGLKPVTGLHLSKLSSKELVGLLSHKNDWYRREARRLLAERRDASVLPLLRQMLADNRGELALQSLWTLYVSGGWSDELAEKLLRHPTEEVRTWTVRFLGDAKKVTPRQQPEMVQLARNDPSPLVRSQLACSARRLPGRDGLPIVRALLRRDEDASDPYIPLLLWWAIEAQATSDRTEVVQLLETPADWQRPLVRQVLLERIGRRYLAEGKVADYEACAWLLEKAPGKTELQLLVQGMERAVQARPLANVPAVLQQPLARLIAQQPENIQLVRFALRLGSDSAYRQALATVTDARQPDAIRTALLEALGQQRRPESLAPMLKVFTESKSNGLKQAGLTALQAYQDNRVSAAVLDQFPRLTGTLRSQARSLLCSRETSALHLLQAIDAKKIPEQELTLDQVRQIAHFKNAAIRSLVEKHWGKIGPATAGEKLTQISHFRTILHQGKGNRNSGEALFTKHCAICHTLFGQGNKIGPDLTGADRKNLDWLLTNIVDPSAVQRLEYANYVLLTTDGRSLVGVVAEASADAVTLVNAKNERSVIPRSSIDEMAPSPVSLMPEKILDPLADQELRDLFTYLQSDNTPKVKPAPGKKGKPMVVCLVSGSLEYKSDESLKKLQEYLESHYNIRCTWAKYRAVDDLPGLENLETCDVALFFTRRMTIKGQQLERVKKYCAAGKPIVGLRTASHGFQNWLAFDKEVLGGNYHNHYKEGPICQGKIIDKDHPILKGVQPFTSPGSLYLNTGIAADTHLLMTGTIPGHTEPLAWTRLHKGGRVFYTSLGHPSDFENEQFVRLVVNALFWTAKRESPK